jgi:type III secretory pathway component EscS
MSNSSGQTMDKEKTSGSISNIVKPIVDITASVAVVVAYLQAIFQLVDTAYPKTVSLLTILFTSAIVVGWRWGKLNEKKTSSSANSKTPVKGSVFERFFAPIKANHRDAYALTLTRRRAEAGLIAALSVFTIGWSGSNVSGVISELTKNPSLTCSYAPGENNLLIIVADLFKTDSQD